MNAERELLNVCREWRRLAEAEGESIGGRNWSLVDACQRAIANLQPRLTRVIQAARREWSQISEQRAGKEKMLREMISDLIRQEKVNADLLAGMRIALSEKQRQLDQAARNLKQIQRSYISQPETAWCSIS